MQGKGKQNRHEESELTAEKIAELANIIGRDPGDMNDPENIELIQKELRGASRKIQDELDQMRLDIQARWIKHTAEEHGWAVSCENVEGRVCIILQRDDRTHTISRSKREKKWNADGSPFSVLDVEDRIKNNFE